jgi:cobalamin biosynthesis protein CobD/CbiB
MSEKRPTPRPPRPTQESPLVWGLLVAIMLIAFINFLFVALAQPTTYRVVLALAAGAFLVLSIVQLVRSSRERRRLRGGQADERPDETGGDQPDDTARE